MTARALIQALPQFAQELEAALRAQHLDDLATQIHELSIVDRCRCGDAFCATFYTAPRQAGASGDDSIIVDDVRGFVALHLVEGTITCVEALYLPDIRIALRSLLP